MKYFIITCLFSIFMVVTSHAEPQMCNGEVMPDDPPDLVCAVNSSWHENDRIHPDTGEDVSGKIRRAVQNSKLARGKNLFLPGGTYRVAREISMPSDTGIVGSPTGMTLLTCMNPNAGSGDEECAERGPAIDDYDSNRRNAYLILRNLFLDNVHIDIESFGTAEISNNALFNTKGNSNSSQILIHATHVPRERLLVSGNVLLRSADVVGHGITITGTPQVEVIGNYIGDLDDHAGAVNHIDSETRSVIDRLLDPMNGLGLDENQGHFVSAILARDNFGIAPDDYIRIENNFIKGSDREKLRVVRVTDYPRVNISKNHFDGWLSGSHIRVEVARDEEFTFTGNTLKEGISLRAYQEGCGASLAIFDNSIQGGSVEYVWEGPRACSENQPTEFLAALNRLDEVPDSGFVISTAPPGDAHVRFSRFNNCQEGGADLQGVENRPYTLNVNFAADMIHPQPGETIVSTFGNFDGCIPFEYPEDSFEQLDPDQFITLIREHSENGRWQSVGRIEGHQAQAGDTVSLMVLQNGKRVLSSKYVIENEDWAEGFRWPSQLAKEIETQYHDHVRAGQKRNGIPIFSPIRSYHRNEILISDSWDVGSIRLVQYRVPCTTCRSTLAKFASRPNPNPEVEGWQIVGRIGGAGHSIKPGDTVVVKILYKHQYLFGLLAKAEYTVPEDRTESYQWPKGLADKLNYELSKETNKKATLGLRIGDTEDGDTIWSSYRNRVWVGNHIDPESIEVIVYKK